MIARNIQFSCPECGGNIGLDVDIQNIFGKIRTSLHTNKIEVTFAGLLARQVKVIGKKFVCMRCGIELNNEIIVITCPFSNEPATIDKFVILRATNKKTEKKSRPVIIHENFAERYIKDAEKSGNDVYKRTAKIELNTEVNS